MLSRPAKRDLRAQSVEQWAEYLEGLGQPRYRAQQLFDWLWVKNADSIGAMTNLPKALRAQLEADFSYHKLEIAHRLQSADGTLKYGFRLWDGKLIEGVLIPSAHGVTACISSQVGCSLDCTFCATGYLKLQRNLEAYEIYEQVALLRTEAQAAFGEPLSHVVYMGMGEPLLNYRNVLLSIEKVTRPEGLGMSPRRLTLSTSGIAKQIVRLADDGLKTEFALSLHSAREALRAQIMPISLSNPLSELVPALVYFYEKTGTRVTYEYVLLDGVNDGPEDVEALIDFSRHIPCKVNLIEYNPIAEADYRPSREARTRAFEGRLAQAGVLVTLRRSRGKDIDGACGQLALRHLPAAG